jgi:hypothetical protein
MTAERGTLMQKAREITRLAKTTEFGQVELLGWSSEIEWRKRH